MSIADITNKKLKKETDEKCDEQRMGAFLSTWDEGLDISEIIGNSSTDVLKGAQFLERTKVRSLFALLYALYCDYPDLFQQYLKLDKENYINNQVYCNLNDINGRYMTSAAMSILSATVEGAAALAYQNTEAREFLDQVVQKLCPELCLDATDEAVFNDAIHKYAKKWTTSKNLTKMKNAHVFIYYVIAWKVTNQNKDAEHLRKLLYLFTFPTDKMFIRKETDTYFDWMARTMQLDGETLLFSRIFEKYLDICCKQIAPWLNDFMVLSNPHKEKLPNYLDYNEDEATAYIYNLFNALIDTCQIYYDMNDVDVEAFGYQPFSFALNALAEIKWDPSNINRDDRNLAFRRALQTTGAAHGYINYDGEDPEDLRKSNLIRRCSNIRNPWEFATNFFYAYILNLINVAFVQKDFEIFNMHYLEDGVFNWVGNPKTSMTPKYASVNMRILEGKEEEISLLKNLIKRLKQEIKQNDKQLAKKMEPLEEEIRALKKQNEKLEKEYDELKERKLKLDSMIEGYETVIGNHENSLEPAEACTDEELQQQRILFAGGRYELIRMLKNTMPNAKFILSETEPLPDFNKIDKVVFFCKFINHSTYHKCFDRLKLFDIPYYFIQTQNYDQVLEILKTI